MSIQLDLSVSASRSLNMVCLGVHGLALSALPFTALGPGWQALVGGCIVAGLWDYWCKMRSDRMPAIRRIHLHRDGNWAVALADGQLHAARLLVPAFVKPGLTVLRYCLDDGRQYAAILLADNVDGDDFRRLRVWLCHGLAAPG